MKTLVSLFLAVLAVSASAEEKVQHRVAIRKLGVQFQQTPQYQVDGVREKDVRPRYWLELEAELDVETTDPTGFIPELRTKWFVVIFGPDTKPVRLDGEVVYQNVRAIDGKAHVIAFIGPDVLEKLTGEERPNESDIDSTALLVSGPGIRTDDDHKEGLQKATGEKDYEWWIKWSHKVASNQILAKSQTPFAPLWSDRFPREKKE